MHVKKHVMSNNSSTTYLTLFDNDPDPPDKMNVTANFEEIKNNTVISASLMFAFGVFGNILALIVLKRSDSDQKRKLFYRLVAGLTMTDLFGTCATSPLVIATYVNDFNWVGGVASCKYFSFMMVFAGVATMTIVCLMSVERILCIRHPYLYYSRLHKNHATYFLIGAWTFAAVVASLPLMGFGEFVLQYPGTWCFFDYYTDDNIHRGYNYLFAILALFMISTTVTSNFLVLYTLFRTKMRGLKRRTSNNGNSRRFPGSSARYAECQMAVLLIGITIVFSSCYLPLMIRIVINQTKLLPVNRPLDLAIIRIASLNQILDPWVYILLRREVVWKIVFTVKSIFTCSKNSQELIQEQQNCCLEIPKQNVDNRNCLVFCWHCMCDPPRNIRRNGSFASSIYYPQSPHSPISRFAFNIANNAALLPSSSITATAQSNIEELRRQASEDSNRSETITEQPKKDTTVVYSNGFGRTKSDHHICETLIENSEDEMDKYSI